jgi:Leucine-rich repeat (LRR) protein
LYKLAPNIKEFYYDQLNGLKIASLNANFDANFYFDLNDDNMLKSSALGQADDQSQTSESTLYSEFLHQIVHKLEILDLSNNNLSNIPSFIFKFKSLREIYLNGNLIEKIPRDLLPVQKLKSVTASSQENERSSENNGLLENIEVMQFNDNKLEQIPDDFFVHFKKLKAIHIANNPLKEPPIEAVCTGVNDINDISNASKSLRDIWNESYTEFAEMSDENLADEFGRLKTLADSSAASYEKMKALQSYMLKYKQREGN